MKAFQILKQFANKDINAQQAVDLVTKALKNVTNDKERERLIDVVNAVVDVTDKLSDTNLEADTIFWKSTHQDEE
jgi:20S proteasome alpha/beta subunit